MMVAVSSELYGYIKKLSTFTDTSSLNFTHADVPFFMKNIFQICLLQIMFALVIVWTCNNYLYIYIFQLKKVSHVYKKNLKSMKTSTKIWRMNWTIR